MVPVERTKPPWEDAYASLLSSIRPDEATRTSESNAMMMNLADAMTEGNYAKAADIITSMLPKFSGQQRDALKALRYELSK